MWRRHAPAVAVCLAVITLMATFAGGAYAAGEVPVEPGTDQKSPGQEKSNGQADQRLAQKVTFFSGYTRLSDAVFQISKLSGIGVLTGRVGSDWQVRDLPVVICANDIQVGHLLKLMADAYYLTLSRTVTNGVYVYRLSRPKSYQGEMDSYSKKENDYPLDHARFVWDTLSRVGSLGPGEVEALHQQIMAKDPDLGINYRSEFSDSRTAVDEIALYGKLVNSIDPQRYSRMMAGEEVVFNAQDPGDVGKLVKDFTRLKQKIVRAMRYNANGHIDSGDFLDESQIATAKVVFKLSASRGFALDGTVVAGSTRLCAFNGDLLRFGLTAANAGVKSLGECLPKPLFPPSFQEMKYFKPLPKDDKAEPSGKCEFKRPSDEHKSLAEVLTAVSKGIGYTIIADDQCDHNDDPGVRAETLFAGRKSLLDVRDCLGRQYKWYVCTDNKSLAVKSSDWVPRYANLVPKAMYGDWLSKASGAGLTLTDYLAARRLTDGQRIYWVQGVKRLNGLMASGLNETATSIVSVLSAMSTSELNLATSGGLPVTSVDAGAFARLVNLLPVESKPPEDVSNLILRVVKESAAEQMNRYTYAVEITGQETRARFPLNVVFPVYSPERENQLQNAVLGK
jgi:hypothetical protein